MKMGFLTNSLVNVGLKDLNSLAKWAKENDFVDLEVGPTVPLDEHEFHKAKETYGVSINTMIYCRNFLSNDKEQAEQLIAELKKRIIFAGKIGAKQVVTTTGILDDSHKGGRYRPELSLEAFSRLFEPILELAEASNVDILLEACPFMGNIAVSPYMWDMIFDKIKSPRLGLAYDPSHLVWQSIDPYAPIYEFAGHIRHVHGKDCELNRDMIARTGTAHMYASKGAWYHKDAGLPAESGHANLWWRYRLPGLGELDWGKILSRLYETGYDGTISIEHEDPVWEGDFDRVSRGVIASKEHIAQFFV